MRRPLTALLAVLVLAALVYQLALRDKTIAGELRNSTPVASIGSGSDAVAVAADGSLLPWLELDGGTTLPTLPLPEPPKGGRVRGPALEQVRVLAAAPVALRPYLAGASYGDAGVSVELRTGIELRFGDATAVRKKWAAAAAVLADPELEALDYVNLQAPGRPSVAGSGHTLPPLP